MHALIVTGGDCPAQDFLKKLAVNAGMIVGADSGLSRILAAGLVPDFVVGDFDSLADSRILLGIPAEKVFHFPVDKDFTDTELAIQLAERQGADGVVLAGGGGGRLDHTLAMYSLFKRKARILSWHTAIESVYSIPQGVTAWFTGPIGMTVSIFPLHGKARDMSSEGLAWPLAGLVWEEGQFGISNRTTIPEVSISSGSIDLLVIFPHTAERFFK
jgi:thiamine pyrophosphokinase